MAKKIFKQFKPKGKRESFKIGTPQFLTVTEIQAQEESKDTYEGPSVEEIEAEISQKKRESEDERRSVVKNAQTEAARIIESSEAGAFQRIKSANDDHKRIIEAANREAEEIIHKAKREADDIIKTAQDQQKELDKEAYDAGFQQGMEKAFEEGKEELNAIVGRLEKILGETINKRNEIIESSEKQLSNIAIIIARKVVKAITESDQSVILRNVSESLRKIKGRAQVTIRVNISDLELTTRHKDDFYRMLDNIENVNVLEDPNIEKGGCIIETDFGDVDARISAQLDEIETAIKNIQPIKDLA